MQQIDPAELKSWMGSEKQFLLLDVREDFEREFFHIGGLHIPMGELMERIEELPTDRPVVLYCEKGIRSVIAIQRLEARGYANLFNLSGGMKAWKTVIS